MKPIGFIYIVLYIYAATILYALVGIPAFAGQIRAICGSDDRLALHCNPPHHAPLTRVKICPSVH